MDAVLKTRYFVEEGQNICFLRGFEFLTALNIHILSIYLGPGGMKDGGVEKTPQ